MQCRGATFRCRLENISAAGALVTMRETTAADLRVGDTCLLRLYHEIEGQYITVEAQIVHHLFAFVGLAFLNLDAETETSLETIMEREERKALDVGYNAVRYSSCGAAERYLP